MNTEAFIAWLNLCNAYQAADYLPFYLDDQPLGAIHRERLSLFSAYPSVFVHTERGLTLHPSLVGVKARSAAVTSLLKAWHTQGIITAWRDEPYRIATRYGAEPLLLLERAAASLFGVQKYGVHLNGYTWQSGVQYLWIARRSRHSPTYPSQLDQVVAGGLGAGYSAQQTLFKEAAEEASIPSGLAERAKPVSLVSYCMTQHQNLVRDLLFIYDLELPPDFVPINSDGEVEAFHLWPVTQVIDKVSETREFKTNTNLVIIDFLVRHGYLTPEHPHYVEITQRLRSHCPF